MLAYAQLLRLPNVFTAFSNICLGALATGALPEEAARFTLLLVASACLYSAGMVWNDYFDLDQDRKERPFRPLPSGRVSTTAAGFLAILLMAAGLAAAALADWHQSGWHSLPIAGALVITILLYDARLKRTWLGPLLMGLCRFLNVLLGLSLAFDRVGMWGMVLAAAVGIYVIGVTWFARTEAQTSRQNVLAAAAGAMLAGVLLALTLPPLGDETLHATSPLFPYLIVVFGFFVGVPVVRAIQRPLPSRVQSAVKRAVLGLIALDAVFATALVGAYGLVLLVLLIPALFLGRWIYST
jgi:4-hydroxybenzoate polyprenyltransferase